MALAKSDRVRLGKMLALLDSDKEGEVLAAARAAVRPVRQRGISWHQVVEPPAVQKTLPEIGTWRQTVARCLEHPGALRRWEIGFLRDLPSFHRLSTKQRYCLKEIADRVLCRETTR